MVETAIKRLEYLCNTIPPLLLVIEEKDFNAKPLLNAWSKKEIIGHLIDSATNNHQRFVRVQFEDKPVIEYDQNQWNHFNFYQKISAEQIVVFWVAYNRQLIEIIKNISVNNLERECLVNGKLLSLNFLINDYLQHMEHHLIQIVSY